MIHGVAAAAVWSTAAQARVQGEQGVRRGEGDDAVEHHRDDHHRHGGHPRAGFGREVMDALQSLGIDLRRSSATSTSGQQPVDAAAQATIAVDEVPPSDPPPTSEDDAGEPSPEDGVSRGELRRDVNHFVHALFRAVRREVLTDMAADKANTGDGSAPATGESSSGVMASMRSAFASGLSSLITDVSNGDAPAVLQATFDELMSDLETSGHAPDGEVTLQDVLTKLQQQMGYGVTGGSDVPAAVGQSVNVTA